ERVVAGGLDRLEAELGALRLDDTGAEAALARALRGLPDGVGAEDALVPAGELVAVAGGVGQVVHRDDAEGVVPGLLERLGSVPRVAGVHLPEEATTAAARVEIDDAAA